MEEAAAQVVACDMFLQSLALIPVAAFLLNNNVRECVLFLLNQLTKPWRSDSFHWYVLLILVQLDIQRSLPVLVIITYLIHIWYTLFYIPPWAQKAIRIYITYAWPVVLLYIRNAPWSVSSHVRIVGWLIRW